MKNLILENSNVKELSKENLKRIDGGFLMAFAVAYVLKEVIHGAYLAHQRCG